VSLTQGVPTQTLGVPVPPQRALRGERRRVGRRAPRRGHDHHEGRKAKPSRSMFLIVLPFLVLVFLFSYLPLAGWVTALYDYKPALGLSGSEFVGLQWFRMLASSPTQLQQVGQVMTNTLAMSFLGIATSLLPVLFAMLLNEIRAKWFRNAVQTLTTLPNFISWVLVYMIAFSLFSTTGLVNTTLQDWGLITIPIKFLDTDSHVWLTMLAWSLWKGLGWGAILYLAAITSIDPALYESARIDGANRFQLMRYITFPQLMPTYVVLLVLSIANILNNGMEQYYVFQNAFNKEHIQVLDLYVYNIGITGNSLSMATALGMLKSIISVILLVTANAIAKRVRGTSII
jgi:multiple sugar transport system permease protein/putative aldouronate transport system permease protein